MIKVKNLYVTYQHSYVLEDISFEIEKGDYLAVVGPNGSGKSTLIKAILGLKKYEKGKVLILGKKLNKFKRWDKIGYLPQHTSIPSYRFPAKVSEIVATGLLSKKSFPKNITHSDKKSIVNALETLGILDLKDKFIGRLSGGQRQRVLLARSIINNPELLILDEPILALDPDARENFYETISKLNKEKGITIVIVSHDVGSINKYANKFLYLDKKLIFFGEFKDFCESEEMSRLFGAGSQHLMCGQHDDE